MTVVIRMKPDTLGAEMQKFTMSPLQAPVFLNSVPKCGTHLIRNILRMFVPAEQQYHKAFVQLPNLPQNKGAFTSTPPFLSWGHLLFSDDSAVALTHVRHIVLVRDPYDWVLARARFFLSEEFNGPLNNIKENASDVSDVLNMMIFGTFGKAPSLLDIFTYNAVAWTGSRAKLYRYEDIVAHLRDLDSPGAETFFSGLLEDCGVARPADWKERIRLGSAREHSATAREHLSGDVSIPDTLPAAQRRLVEFSAPGLREFLGYS